MLKDTDIDRFWKRVDAREASECWPWIGGRTPNGYGAAYITFPDGIRRQCGAHRAALIVAHGAFPIAGAYVLHSCDNKLCVNPLHLRYGTQRDNVRDMWERGRAVPPPRSVKKNRPPKPKPPNRRDKLTAQHKVEILERLHRGDLVKDIARDYGVSTAPVSNLKNHGKTWVPKA